MKAAHKIIARLYGATRPLMVHEIRAEKVSDTSCSARLRELAREGIVVSVPVKGTKMTAWMLTPQDLVLNLTGTASRGDSPKEWHEFKPSSGSCEPGTTGTRGDAGSSALSETLA